MSGTVRPTSSPETGVRCAIWRGGTSKGLFFEPADLPADPDERDDLLRRLMGTPDPRQIDGLGGAHPLTSKVAIVGPSGDARADLSYLFLQLGVDRPTVTDRQNCGNLLAAVGPFALERRLVEASGNAAAIRILMRNTGSTVTARFPVAGGRLAEDGSTSISGVPGTAAAIELDFDDIAGGSCGALLPTGNRIDRIDGVDCTLIDNGMPVVVMAATDLGVSGHEDCADLEANQHLREQLERIRLTAGPMMGLGDVVETTVPKLTLASAAGGSGHLATRTFIPHRCHDAIGVLGAVSVATAARLPGSVAQPLTRGPQQHEDPATVVLEHPTGTFETSVTLTEGRDGTVAVGRAGIVRTARLLMDGTAHPRPSTS